MKNRMRRFIKCIPIFLPVFVISGCSEETVQELARTETKNIDPWTYLTNTDISTNSTLREFASSASGLMITIGVMGIVFSIFYLIIRLLFGGSSAKVKSEIKDEVIFKSVVAIMLFSIPFWLGIIKLISDLLV